MHDICQSALCPRQALITSHHTPPPHLQGPRHDAPAAPPPAAQNRGPGGSHPPTLGLPMVLTQPLPSPLRVHLTQQRVASLPVTLARGYCEACGGQAEPCVVRPRVQGCLGRPGSHPLPSSHPSSFSKVVPVWINMIWPTKFCVTPNHLRNTYMFPCLGSS